VAGARPLVYGAAMQERALGDRGPVPVGVLGETERVDQRVESFSKGTAIAGRMAVAERVDVGGAS